MNEKINAALDALFEGYPPSDELRDLREEIAANLHVRIEESTSKGDPAEVALAQALRELGDITEVADSVSRKERNKVIGEMYRRKIPLDKLHAAGYPIAGMILVFGLICAVIAGLGGDSLSTLIGAFMPFLTVAGAGCVFLGLTQETHTHYPMGKKRAGWYALGAAFLLFGACTGGVTLFRDVPLTGFSLQGIGQLKLDLIALDPVASLGVLLVFVVPALAMLAFLVLTEKDRQKPWVHEQAQQYSEAYGMLSGALWVFTAAVFVTLGLLIGFGISWVVFLFAAGVQCVIQYVEVRKKERAGS